MKKNFLTEELKPKVIELYIDKNYGFRKVADILNIPESQVLKFLKNENLIRKIGTTKIYSCNEFYFNDIKSEKQAYWLGVLFADGNVSKQGETFSGRVIFSSKDTEWVDQFKRDIEFNGKIYTETHKVYKTQVSKVSLTSEQMFTDLVELGCIPNKSLIIRIPAINQDLIPHFIRGYFDGDGTVGIYKNSSKSNTMTLRSGFCSGSQEFLEAISCYLPTNRKVVKKANNRNLFTLMFSVNDSINLYQYMYKDATVWLKRKREKFEEYIQERCSETIISLSK